MTDRQAPTPVPPPPTGEPEFDDLFLRARLQSMLGDTQAPAALVRAVEQHARRRPTVVTPRSPWADILPALASLTLVGSLLAGALGSLPIQHGISRLLGAGGGSPSILGLCLGLPLAVALTIELMRGAPLLRRLGR